MTKNVIKLDKSEYQDLLLADYVEGTVLHVVQITINRIEPYYDSDGNIVQGRKVVEIRQGDKVEIIALNNLDLNYYFGKVFYIGNDFVQLDISSSCESGAVFIKLKDIRDVEVCNDAEFKLRPILAEPPEEER